MPPIRRSGCGPEHSDLAQRQHQVLSRGQLRQLGIGEPYVTAQLDARRWQPWGPHVIVMHNGPLYRRQLLHAATLHVGAKGCLAARSALEPFEFKGFVDWRIHVVHPRASSVPPMPDLVVHESRRLSPADIQSCADLRTTSPPRAAIDLSAWQPYPRFAYAVLAAVVQQRLTTGRRLFAALDAAGAVRHAQHMRAAIADIAAGAQTLGELDLTRMCRRFEIASPARQRMRRDAQGRSRYLDAEWDCPDGSVLVLEVDGLHHLDAAYWVVDMKRERAFVRPGRRVLRCANVELRLEADAVAADLIANGVPRATPTKLSPAHSALTP